MIIFYHKDTGRIIGMVEGRVHNNGVLKNVFIETSEFPKDKVGKYIVPFKPVEEVVEEPIVEQRVVDKQTMRVEEVVVGKRRVKRIKELKPDVPFSDLILRFEGRKESIYDYKMNFDKGGRVKGFQKIKKLPNKLV